MIRSKDSFVHRERLLEMRPRTSQVTKIKQHSTNVIVIHGDIGVILPKRGHIHRECPLKKRPRTSQIAKMMKNLSQRTALSGHSRMVGPQCP